MTLAASTRRAGPFTGDGATVTFSLGFDIDNDTDIRVWLRDTTDSTDDEGTLQTLTTHYTVNTSTNQITMVTAPTSDEELVILGNQPVAQSTNFTGSDGISSTSLENLLDDLTKIKQELDWNLQQCLRMAKFNQLTNDTTAVYPNLDIPTSDDEGKPLVLTSATTLRHGYGSGAHFVSDESQTALVTQATQTGNIAWTDVDITTQIAGASKAVVSVSLSMTSTGASPTGQVDVFFRKNGNSTTGISRFFLDQELPSSGNSRTWSSGGIFVDVDTDDIFEYSTTASMSNANYTLVIYFEGYVL